MSDLGYHLLPTSGVLHAGPRLCGWERIAFLQQFNRNAVGTFNKCHMTVTWRAMNHVPKIGEVLAERIDILDSVG
jgi:hypothetical protein